MGGGHWTADEGLGGRGHSTDGSFLLFRVAWLSQAKTCPEARPACTGSSAAQTEGWTFVFGSPPWRMEGGAGRGDDGVDRRVGSGRRFDRRCGNVRRRRREEGRELRRGGDFWVERVVPSTPPPTATATAMATATFEAVAVAVAALAMTGGHGRGGRVTTKAAASAGDPNCLRRRRGERSNIIFCFFLKRTIGRHPRSVQFVRRLFSAKTLLDKSPGKVASFRMTSHIA